MSGFFGKVYGLRSWRLLVLFVQWYRQAACLYRRPGILGRGGGRMVKALYDGRLATNIAGLKMKTPITTASGTFGFGLEFTDFLDLEK